ncbi:MAG TPA: zinc-binding dehydrogenase [Candidatus Limnocylindrales bacterium]|nr:zinc-binding dehydrogenase [Candidatus Limnocylindrales bacterium]
MTAIPSTMRAVQLKAYDGKPESISVAEIAVPRPGPGEVLVRVHASPINPSDQAFIAGLYGFKKPLPAIPGFEGSGTVVDAGPGFMAQMLKGRRVACAVADAKLTGGMWAEYVVTSAKTCIPLKGSVDLEQAAMMLVNPLTAWALMHEARRGGHAAAVQTAAASALGRMVIRLGQRFSMPVINIVRRAEQVELLKGMGAEHVLNSDEADFDAKLHELCHRLRATIGFDAVSGELSAHVLRAMANGGRLLVYGGLSLAACQADPTSLIFEGKRLEGFWLSEWLRRRNLLAQMRVAGEVQKLLGSDLKSEVQARLPLEEAARGLEQYALHMTAGKVLFMPGQ